jgi:thiol:disulfide interchange protein
MKYKIQVQKIIASLLIGLSLSIYYWLGTFIYEQSQWVLRNIYLNPAFLKLYGPIGVALGIIVFIIIRKSKRTFLIVGVLSFIIALVAWWFIQIPFVEHLILPPTTYK